MKKLFNTAKSRAGEHMQAAKVERVPMTHPRIRPVSRLYPVPPHPLEGQHKNADIHQLRPTKPMVTKPKKHHSPVRY